MRFKLKNTFKMNKNKKKLQEMRQLNINASVGSTITCPSCNTSFIKNSYQTVFCKTKGRTKCKDHYWNNIDESKRNNTTRISPANLNYQTKMALSKGFPDIEIMKNYVDDSDGSWEVHQCYVENCEYCGLKPEYCRCEDY
jgi:hypothetical protein